MGRVIVFLLRGMGSFYYYSPLFLKKSSARFLGRLLEFSAFRLPIVKKNLEIAFQAEPSGLIRKSYEHLGALFLELLLLFGPLKKFVLKNVDFEGQEHFEQASAQKKGVIFLSSHVGNWEIMAASGVLFAKADLLLVTKKLKPEWFFKAVQRGRKTCGVSATYEPKTLREVLSHLKQHKAVGFVLDQYAGPPVGVRVPFFGIPVGTSSVVATLAKRTQAPVLPVFNYRKPDGRWVVQIRAPLAWKSDPDPRRELALNTAGYVKQMEEDILKCPEQWLWIHNRFKGDLTPLRKEEWLSARVRS